MWGPGIIVFVYCLAYGVWLWRSPITAQERFREMPRKKRVLFGSVGFIGSLIALIVGLSYVALGGGSTKDGILPLGWLVLILSALVFVHLQVLGAASLLSLVLHETPNQAPTSDINEHTS